VVSADVGTQTGVGTFDHLEEPVNITFPDVHVNAGIKQNGSTFEVSRTSVWLS